ncbi:hypothetical protein FOZ63_031489 [Perkinsus olseni]|uniref:C2H2-type domain-containing protein n=1 Tax=Perkinsus olseni TaxID=32597 RepID=A0A7J6RA88_PEROL|nr:hypothetical protein FOZ63_031489 [Perkinsus olseni]
MYCAPSDLLLGEEEAPPRSGVQEGSMVQPRSEITVAATANGWQEGRPKFSDLSSSSAELNEVGVITPSGPPVSSPTRARGHQPLASNSSIIPVEMTPVTTTASCDRWGYANNWHPPSQRSVELRVGRRCDNRGAWRDDDSGAAWSCGEVTGDHNGERGYGWRGRRSRSKSRGRRGDGRWQWQGEQWQEDFQPSESVAWPSAAEGRVYEVAVPPSAERPLVSSALSTEERRRRFAELGDRSESKIKYVLATSPLSHMFFDDGAESFLAPVQQARIDFLGAPMDENETGLIEFGSSSRLYCVFCDQNKQCPPGKMIKFSLTHLRGHQHKWRKSYYREQLDMCAEFNRRLDLIKSHQIFLKLRPHNGEAIAHKYWCRLCKRGLKGFVEIRDHLRHDYHTQRIAMHAFCEKEGIRVPTRRLGEEVSTKSHFVEVPNVEYLTKDDMDRNGIVITDGVNYPEEPSGWLYCTYCRKKFSDPQRLEEHCKSWRHVLACTPKSS